MGNTVSGKHLNIDLDFNANTSKAIKEIQNLQAALDKVVANATKSSVGVGAEDIKNLREASNAASELKVHLEQATNVKTGQLDLTKLNASFKSAGKNLSDYNLIKDEIICEICQGILIKPKQCEICESIFCEKCIKIF